MAHPGGGAIHMAKQHDRASCPPTTPAWTGSVVNAFRLATPGISTRLPEARSYRLVHALPGAGASCWRHKPRLPHDAHSGATACAPRRSRGGDRCDSCDPPFASRNACRLPPMVAGAAVATVPDGHRRVRPLHRAQRDSDEPIRQRARRIRQRAGQMRHAHARIRQVGADAAISQHGARVAMRCDAKHRRDSLPRVRGDARTRSPARVRALSSTTMRRAACSGFANGGSATILPPERTRSRAGARLARDRRVRALAAPQARAHKARTTAAAPRRQSVNGLSGRQGDEGSGSPDDTRISVSRGSSPNTRR